MLAVLVAGVFAAPILARPASSATAVNPGDQFVIRSREGLLAWREGGETHSLRIAVSMRGVVTSTRNNEVGFDIVKGLVTAQDGRRLALITAGFGSVNTENGHVHIRGDFLRRGGVGGLFELQGEARIVEGHVVLALTGSAESAGTRYEVSLVAVASKV